MNSKIKILALALVPFLVLYFKNPEAFKWSDLQAKVVEVLFNNQSSSPAEPSHATNKPASNLSAPNQPKSLPSESTRKLANGVVELMAPALVERRNNDGDSFWIRYAEGNSVEARLYFVDTPESAIKTYRDGNTNRDRVVDQARYFGITQQQVVDIGKEAKEFTLNQLRSERLRVFTADEAVYNSPRRYVWIQIAQKEGTWRWLDEILVEKGLVRVHTKGADLPGGVSKSAHLARLKELEAKARQARVGAWAMSS